MIAFHIPGEPVAKGRPRFVRSTGVVYTPSATINYERDIAQRASLVMGYRGVFEGPLRMTIRATYPHPKSWTEKRKRAEMWKTSKPDADNLAKIVKDACNKIVYRDDAQISELTVQKKYGPLAGLTVSIEPLPQHDGVA